jgi:hypothetical protein
LELRVQVWSVKPEGNGVTTEAEDFLSVEAVARKRPVETVID